MRISNLFSTNLKNINFLLQLYLDKPIYVLYSTNNDLKKQL